LHEQVVNLHKTDRLVANCYYNLSDSSELSIYIYIYIFDRTLSELLQARLYRTDNSGCLQHEAA